MAKYRAEIEVPDNASWQTIEDAKLCAVWREIFSVSDRMARTDLTDKCGSCKHFCPYKRGNALAYGRCLVKRMEKERSMKKCKLYERRIDE